MHQEGLESDIGLHSDPFMFHSPKFDEGDESLDFFDDEKKEVEDIALQEKEAPAQPRAMFDSTLAYVATPSTVRCYAGVRLDPCVTACISTRDHRGSRRNIIIWWTLSKRLRRSRCMLPCPYKGGRAGFVIRALACQSSLKLKHCRKGPYLYHRDRLIR